MYMHLVIISNVCVFFLLPVGDQQVIFSYSIGDVFIFSSCIFSSVVKLFMNFYRDFVGHCHI